MGSPPPEDGPPLEEQEQQVIDAGFEPAPTGSALCGFAIPPLFFFNLNIPAIPPLPDFPPLLFFALSLNCDLDNPLDADLSFGGGRVSQVDSDADPDDDNAPDT